VFLQQDEEVEADLSRAEEQFQLRSSPWL
jgi:hypothetical protein